MSERDLVAQGSPDRFGYEWATYDGILPEYEEQFRRWSCLVKIEDWQGKSFIDVGCGTGRNSYWPIKYGAARGISIDVDNRSLASAKRNLAEFANVEVRNQSAYEIAEENEIDIVYSIGVIHHLADPKRALARMFRATKPGGRMFIWVYGLENNKMIAYGLSPIRRVLFSKMPIKITHALSWLPSALLFGMLKLGYGKTKYHNLIRTFTFPHLRSIVFDQMLPHIAHYWSEAEVRQLMTETGLTDIQLEWVNEMSWCAIGTKPQPA